MSTQVCMPLCMWPYEYYTHTTTHTYNICVDEKAVIHFTLDSFLPSETSCAPLLIYGLIYLKCIFLIVLKPTVLLLLHHVAKMTRGGEHLF